MDQPSLRFALRELRGFFARPATLGILVALSLVIGIAGPFGTSEFMRLVPRLGYWIVMTFATFSAGVFVHGLLPQPDASAPGRLWRGIITSALFAGIAVAFVVLAVNFLALGVVPDDPQYIATTGANALAIAVIISVTMAFQEIGSPSKSESLSDAAPRILSRLDHDKRGKLVSISVADHYVEVSTSKGKSLLLMRLADAILETEGVQGLQVHRSHWVTHDGVKSGKREGDRGILTLHNGDEIPVSRTYLKAVKDSGLLDRK